MTYRILTAAAALGTLLVGCAQPSPISNVRQLTFKDMGLSKSGEAYFSPDAQRIIFQAFPEGEDAYQMFTMELDADGIPRRETLKQVSPGGGACTCGYFRPDGGGIIFGSSYLSPDMENPNSNRYQRKGSDYTWNMPGGMDIIAANTDGSNPRQLTNVSGYDAECAYSNDGGHIVFASDRDGDPDLYIMDADGSNVRQVTDNPGYDGGPFFSPDGTRIIFRADRHQDDYLQIFVINADGSGERQLTPYGKIVNWAPFWHPDGRSIVWTTSRHGHHNYEVYLMNVDTGRQMRITDTPRFDGLPVFSPDGRWLMWTSARTPEGECQIFLADFTLPDGF